ncbi:MAG: DUF2062 domain-containing protein [Rhodospirillales bacterium]|nr:DUF2062 domain-containing protein [Rhodospirillales bacterium]
MVRAGLYLLRRMQRIPGTPHRLAIGFACGASLSMTPFIGLHGVGAIVLSWALGGSWVTALIGTAIGNPWTFPLIWIVIYQTGAILVPGVAVGDVSMTAVTSELVALASAAANLALAWDIDLAIDDLARLRLLPTMTVGSIPYTIVVWIASYYAIRSSVSQYQKIRRMRIRTVRQNRLARLRGGDVNP